MKLVSLLNCGNLAPGWVYLSGLVMGHLKTLWRLLSWPLRALAAAFGRVAASAIILAVLIIALGMSPADWLVGVYNSPPLWLVSGWTRLGFLLIGLLIVFISLHAGKFTRKRRVLDHLSQEISWAIEHILNKPRPREVTQLDAYASELRASYDEWCGKIDRTLSDRMLFTQSDFLHFNRLGFIQPVAMTGHKGADHTLSMLRLKFERLRDIILDRRT